MGPCLTTEARGGVPRLWPASGPRTPSPWGWGMPLWGMRPLPRCLHLPCPEGAVGVLRTAGGRKLTARGAVSAGCKYNQVNSHFHCIREGCQFSFLLKHQMTSHARKHMRRMLGKNFDRVPPSQVSARAPRGRSPRPARRDSLPSVHSTAPPPPPAQLPQGTPSSSQGPPSLMDTETDEYMDYTGCSPGAVSSESPTMDRSCSSTPVGNESTAPGERGAGRRAGQEETSGAGRSQPKAPHGPSQDWRFMVKRPRRTEAASVCGRASWSGGR